MPKLTREQKIELYQKRKQGYTLSLLSERYKTNQKNVRY